MQHFGLDYVRMIPGHNPYYDAFLYKRKNIWYRIEIKTDYAAERFGNLYFEMHNCWQNRPSGLTITKADHYAHYVPCHDIILWYEPAQIKMWLANAERMSRPGVKYKDKAGDNNSEGFVVPYEDIASRAWVKKIPAYLP